MLTDDVTPMKDTTAPCTPPPPEFTAEGITSSKHAVISDPPVMTPVLQSKIILGADSAAGSSKVEKSGDEGTPTPPAQLFKMLSVETDLNVPPENWLRGEVGERGKNEGRGQR
eukprot:sb/3476999/